MNVALLAVPATSAVVLLAGAASVSATPGGLVDADVCPQVGGCVHLAAEGSGAELTLAPQICGPATIITFCAPTAGMGAHLSTSAAGSSSAQYPVTGTCSWSGSAGSKVTIHARGNASPTAGATVTDLVLDCYVHVNGVRVATVSGTKWVGGVWTDDSSFDKARRNDVITVCVGRLAATWSDGHVEDLAEC